MMNSFTPSYLTSLVPQPVSNLSRYNLRNSTDLQSINARTKQYYHSFPPSAVRAWNNLPVETKQSASLQCFKNYLKKNTQTQVPKHYYIGSRRAQILHTRLRTNCSSLNLHLFLKNITESPLCRCGSIENTEHFFLYCRYHQAQRDELISVITPYQVPTTNLFLYGDENLSEQTNKLIFESVQTFIIGTKRF